MEPMHLKLTGETTQNLTDYTGSHRAFASNDRGVAYIPLGDRNRVPGIVEEGVVLLEERDNEKLTKYLKLR